jgi:hypothetical protein
MKQSQWLLAGITLLSTTALAQNITRVQKSLCQSGDVCRLIQESTDSGKTFVSLEGTIDLHDQALREKIKPVAGENSTDIAQDDDDSVLLFFSRGKDGTIDHVATKSALEEIFDKKKDSALLAKGKAFETRVLKMTETVFGKEGAKKIRLWTEIDYSIPSKIDPYRDTSILLRMDYLSNGDYLSGKFVIHQHTDDETIFQKLRELKARVELEEAEAKSRPANLLSEVQLKTLKAARQEHVSH